MHRFEMAFPESLAEAGRLSAAHENSRVIAGGTALMVVLKEGLYAPDLLINIRGLAADHAYVRNDPAAVRIGALTTLREIEQSRVVAEELPVVAECIQEIAGVRVRNSATIGGHLAHADIHLDLPPVLAGYDAEVVIASPDGRRTTPLLEFMTGYYETTLAADELIEAVRIPKPEAGHRGTYRKHRYFSAVDWPCVGVAAFGTDRNGGLEGVRVLLNSVAPTPILEVTGIDEAVDGHLTEGAIETIGEMAREQAQPTSDIRGSADYKRRVAGVMTRRALEAIA